MIDLDADHLIRARRVLSYLIVMMVQAFVTGALSLYLPLYPGLAVAVFIGALLAGIYGALAAREWYRRC